ncbi:hypothetical protein [Marixanthomonas spongiae]|uniref:Lipoprotein n=1 Tax=Marixanthomonas spongiae TaxID=2174845 RepID=A0A2U0HSB1_9FLAO|nr:hypothetical protein [Marixanthomonas spongiae]PVW11717.1 hypothetical protein DDV96_15580 [Marixanthomonas spongiae]
MKKLVLILIVAQLLISCSTDDDPRSDYPKKMDITFQLQASDVDRNVQIKSSIIGKDLEIINKSNGNTVLPYKKEYIQQKIPFDTNLVLEYQDYSTVMIGESFQPYTITLYIKINNDIVSKKEVEIRESGQVEFTLFDIE